MYRRIGGLVIALVALVMAAPWSDAQTTIWPLGDSITYGEGMPGGYRERLYVRLTASQYGGPSGFKMVGTAVINSSAVLTAASQQRHEGHRGYRIDEISTNLNGSDNTTVYDDTNHGGYWLTGGPGGTIVPSTDNILLMIGTNDFLQNRDLANADDRLSALVGKLTTLRPNANVFVSNITPLTTSIYGSKDVSGYNAAIPGIVKSYADAGKHVYFVDQYSNFFDTGGNLRYMQADGTHPNVDGYNAMGETWARALQDVPEPGGMFLVAGAWCVLCRRRMPRIRLRAAGIQMELLPPLRG